jgi:pimeloyl-ACP methyl ester carboxylesterase
MLPLDSRTSPADAPSLAYTQAGAGPDVILIHGALVDRTDMLLALAPALSANFRVTAFDRPGHGGSGRLGPLGSPWRQAEAVLAGAAELGLRRPIVIGHSWGGTTALAMALQAPDAVAGVISVAPMAFPELRLEHLLFAARSAPVVGQWLNAAATPVDAVLLPVLWRAMFAPQAPPPDFLARFPFADVAQRNHVEAEGEDAALLNLGLTLSALNYGRCRTPVAVFTGDRDVVVDPSRHAYPLARLLPRGELEVVEGLGHMLHHFAQARIVERALAMTGACADPVSSRAGRLSFPSRARG